MARLAEEVLPLVQQRFAVSSDPSRVCFGGGSFAVSRAGRPPQRGQRSGPAAGD
jgi:hypothetical protein